MGRRLSGRFWIIGAGVVAAGALSGIALGSFAGGHYGGGVWQDRSGYETPKEDSPADPVLTAGANAVAEGDPPPLPGEIVCKGCGPTLAERNMMADAYATGDSDPALQDYEAAGHAAEPGVGPPAIVSTVTKTPVSEGGTAPAAP